MDDENASLERFSPRKFQLGENRVGDVEATTDKFRWFDASSNCGYLNYHWETRSLKFLREYRRPRVSFEGIRDHENTITDVLLTNIDRFKRLILFVKERRVFELNER